MTIQLLYLHALIGLCGWQKRHWKRGDRGIAPGRRKRFSLWFAAAGDHPQDFGYEIHAANILLGKVAAGQNDTQNAERYLLAAGRLSSTSPALRTYGPDLELAQQMLKAGKRDTVMHYLFSCRRFWTMGRELLDHWITELRTGGIPTLDKSAWMRTRTLGNSLRSLRDQT